MTTATDASGGIGESGLIGATGASDKADVTGGLSSCATRRMPSGLGTRETGDGGAAMGSWVHCRWIPGFLVPVPANACCFHSVPAERLPIVAAAQPAAGDGCCIRGLGTGEAIADESSRVTARTGCVHRILVGCSGCLLLPGVWSGGRWGSRAEQTSVCAVLG